MGQVAVLFGGPAPEHDVSILTGLQAVRELTAARRDPVAIYWTKTGAFCSVDPTLEALAFLEGPPKGAEPLTLVLGADGGFSAAGRLGRPRRLELDAVLLCTHGGPGEDGTLQGALDLAGVRYTGPTVAGAAIGMDKLAFAAVVAHGGVTALPRVELTASTDDLPFAAPFIVKPRFGGSSIGIEVVDDLATAVALLRASTHLAQGAVVEPFRPDLTDLQLAVRTHPALELSAIERPLRRTDGAAILDYADKYVAGEGMSGAPRQLPAQLADATVAAVHEAARTVASLCSLRGVARIDFLFGDAGLYVNEINTIPGSLSRYLFIDPVVPFLQLLDDLVDEARRAPTHQYSAAGADGTVLRAAGSIASKLA